MAYHPRIESKSIASFLTTRSRNAELWFINNQKLEETVLASAAKCAERYEVKLFALAIEGNHIQGPALFPLGNRANFMRDFNSIVARAVPRHTPEYPGGRFWGRRYSAEFLPGAEDIEDRFFYTVLQPVNDGLVERISEYPGYNCFHDAVHGIERHFKVVRWAEYNAAKRNNSAACIKDFTQTVTLKYERLPGYENLSQTEYARLMCVKLETKRLEILERRKKDGLGFAGRSNILRTLRGAKPLDSKTSHRYSHRPRVLSICPLRKAQCLSWYFQIYEEYKQASLRFRSGELYVKFPEGTYRPYLP